MPGRGGERFPGARPVAPEPVDVADARPGARMVRSACENLAIGRHRLVKPKRGPQAVRETDEALRVALVMRERLLEPSASRVRITPGQRQTPHAAQGHKIVRGATQHFKERRLRPSNRANKSASKVKPTSLRTRADSPFRGPRRAEIDERGVLVPAAPQRPYDGEILLQARRGARRRSACPRTGRHSHPSTHFALKGANFGRRIEMRNNRIVINGVEHRLRRRNNSCAA